MGGGVSGLGFESGHDFCRLYKPTMVINSFFK